MKTFNLSDDDLSRAIYCLRARLLAVQDQEEVRTLARIVASLLSPVEPGEAVKSLEKEIHDLKNILNKYRLKEQMEKRRLNKP